MKAKQAYEPPAFRQVRLEVRESVLALCQRSYNTVQQALPRLCTTTNCSQLPAPTPIPGL